MKRMKLLPIIPTLLYSTICLLITSPSRSFGTDNDPTPKTTAPAEITTKLPSVVIGDIISDFLNNSPADCGATGFPCMGGHTKVSEGIKNQLKEALKEAGITVLASPIPTSTYYSVSATMTLEPPKAQKEYCHLSGTLKANDLDGKNIRKKENIEVMLQIPSDLRTSINDSQARIRRKLNALGAQCLRGASDKIRELLPTTHAIRENTVGKN